MLWQQVEKNITDREERGIDQRETRRMLKSLDNHVKVNMKAGREDKTPLQDKSKIDAHLRELFVEANAQLGLMKLPERVFGRYKPLMKAAIFENLKKKYGGADPRIEHRKAEISNKNQQDRKIYAQLSDGSVPSFDQFKRI